jgi:hypothetical protein
MLNPIIMYELGKARQRDLLKAAEQCRPVRQARAGQPSLSARLLERLGGLPIRVAARLKERHISPQIGTLREA